MLEDLTEEDIELILNSDDPELRDIVDQAMAYGYYSCVPRPDSPEDFDEQTSFVNDLTNKFTIALGGTGSGKTFAAALKTARYVLDTLPPREHCPFWIVGDTYDTTCAVCWLEKLAEMIPPAAIHSFDWYKPARKWPYAVMLKHPTRPGKIGWILVFKSYMQGLKPMKSESIGGYWCNEEVPYPVIEEIKGRCRDYDSPGWADFTPVEVVSPEWPELYENPPESWRFYHLNTEKNWAIEQEWTRKFLAQIPEDMRETRRTGVFATYRGQVFKEWRTSIHVIDPIKIESDWKRIRALDFGFNNPFCCLWIARDRDGRYYVYDEHYESQKLISYHAEKIRKRYWKDGSPYFGKTFSDHAAQERAELSAEGINCTPANKSINAGIEVLRRLMMVKEDGKPQLYVFKRCEKLIKEIFKYRWPEGTDSRNPADVPVDVNNHAIDAMRYGIYSDWLEQNGRGRPEAKNYQREERNKFGIVTGGGAGLLRAIRQQLGAGRG